jgi:hypothetical protein
MKNIPGQFDFFQPAAPVTPLDGLKAELKPCRCGASLATIGPGAGPHAASLTCVQCHAPRFWMQKAEHAFLCAAIKQFGIPDQPILIRRSAHARNQSNSNQDKERA